MTRRIVLSLGVAALAAGLVLGTALAQSGGGSETKTWTTVFKSPISIEGLYPRRRRQPVRAAARRRGGLATS